MHSKDRWHAFKPLWFVHISVEHRLHVVLCHTTEKSALEAVAISMLDYMFHYCANYNNLRCSAFFPLVGLAVLQGPIHFPTCRIFRKVYDVCMSASIRSPKIDSRVGMTHVSNTRRTICRMRPNQFHRRSLVRTLMSTVGILASSAISLPVIFEKEIEHNRF